MRILINPLLISLILVVPSVFAYSPIEQQNVEEIEERLDSLDAEIDNEERNNVIDTFRADDLHNQVASIRNQAQNEMYETGTLNQEADAVEQELSPLP